MDDAKPVACGACGGEETFLRDFVQDLRPGYQILWQNVCCGCHAAGSRRNSKHLAISAWNAMWAGRAGEATRKVMESVVRERQRFHKADCKGNCGYSFRTDFMPCSIISDALAELGLSTPT